MKTLVILSQYKAVPATFLCRGCAFEDIEGWCPEAGCKGIIWEKIKVEEEVIEE